MTLAEAKKQVDHTLASLFYDRMRSIKSGTEDAPKLYLQAANETGELLMHMKSRLDILFGQDGEALTQFLIEAGIVPGSSSNQ